MQEEQENYAGVECNAPTLDDDDIRMIIQSGMLGDQVRHVTVEQLKTATPALMKQLCVSILQQLDVDTDNLSQPFLQPELKNPEHHQGSMFLTMHLPLLINNYVPQCNSRRFCCSDILFPKWKRTRRFLSIVINYLRFVEQKMPIYNELNAKSEEIHQKVVEVTNHNEKIEKVISEIDDYLSRHASEHQRQQQELQDAEKEFEKILVKNDEKKLEKEEQKQALTRETERLDSCMKEISKLSKEIDEMKQSVVASPERHLTEKDALVKRLNLCKDACANEQDGLSAIERKLDNVTQTIKLLQFIQQQLSDSQSFIDKLKVLQTGDMKQQFEIESGKVSLTRLTQETDKLKQQISDEREYSHRTKVRLQNQLSALKNRLQEINREKEMITSKAEDKGNHIRSVFVSIEKEEAYMKALEEEHQEEMRKLKNVEARLRNSVEKMHQLILERMSNSTERLCANLQKEDFQLKEDKSS